LQSVDVGSFFGNLGRLQISYDLLGLLFAFVQVSFLSIVDLVLVFKPVARRGALIVLQGICLNLSCVSLFNFIFRPRRLLLLLSRLLIHLIREGLLVLLLGS
jgi:hypothetical protein